MRIATFATTVCLAPVGTIVCAQSVTYDFDRAANFTRLNGQCADEGAQTKNIVWRGIATTELDASPEKKEKNINKTAEKIFKNYPPASR